MEQVSEVTEFQSSSPAQ